MMIAESLSNTNGINIYNEKPLHAGLKRWYTQPGDLSEVKVEGSIIDLVRGDLLVEIQTGDFSALKRKLFRLVENHPIRLVYPIPAEKWILMTSPNEDGLASRRKSPKRGDFVNVFSQTIYIPDLIHHPNFSLEALLIREEEVRRPVAKKHIRSKGWITLERRLLEVVDRRVFETAEDLTALLPAALPDPFTARALAKALRQRVGLAQKMAYTLRGLGEIVQVGKKGRAFLYSRNA